MAMMNMARSGKRPNGHARMTGTQDTGLDRAYTGLCTRTAYDRRGKRINHRLNQTTLEFERSLVDH